MHKWWINHLAYWSAVQSVPLCHGCPQHLKNILITKFPMLHFQWKLDKLPGPVNIVFPAETRFYYTMSYLRLYSLCIWLNHISRFWLDETPTEVCSNAQFIGWEAKGFNYQWFLTEFTPFPSKLTNYLCKLHKICCWQFLHDFGWEKSNTRRGKWTSSIGMATYVS